MLINSQNKKADSQHYQVTVCFSSKRRFIVAKHPHKVYINSQAVH